MPTRWSQARASREMRWHEIGRAAVILGIVPDFTEGSMRKIADILRKRVESGRVGKRKEGEAQSAAAFYWLTGIVTATGEIENQTTQVWEIGPVEAERIEL